MKYADQKARAIQQRYGLSATTIRVWKTRGAIPDKYSREVDTSDPANPGLQRRVLDALTDRRVYTKNVTSVPTQKVQDVKRGGSSFTESEVKELRREITTLRNLLRRFTQGRSETVLVQIINHPLVHPYVLFKDLRGMVDRLRHNEGSYVSEDEAERARVEVAKLYSDLKF